MIQEKRKPAALPVYLQISEFLIREIAAGRLADGERLPPEREMAKQYNTSVRTLRKSLLQLIKAGLLKSVQGSGNYIQSNHRAQSIYSMFRLELNTGGGLPSAQILEISLSKKPDTIPQFGTSKSGNRIRRLRFLNEIPIAVEEIWLDHDCGDVNLNEISDSLYRYYQRKLGLLITRAIDKVSIDKVPGWSPKGFGLSSNETTSLVERMSWAQQPDPVEYSRTWFDTRLASYVQRIT